MRKRSTARADGSRMNASSCTTATRPPDAASQRTPMSRDPAFLDAAHALVLGAAGVHARTSVGVFQRPKNATVELDAITDALPQFEEQPTGPVGPSPGG